MIPHLVAKFPGQAAELWLESVRGKHFGLEPDWMDSHLTPLFTRSVAFGQVTLFL